LPEEMKGSEESYRSLIELCPDMVAIHDQGKFYYVNQAGIKLLGASGPEDLIGKSCLDIIHPDYLDIVKERIENLERGEAVPLIEEKYIGLNGRIVDVEVASSPISFHGRTMFQSIVRDIGARKKAEEALRRSEREASRLSAENALLAEIGRLINSSLNIEEVYEGFVQEVQKLLPVDRCVFNVIDSGDTTATITYVWGIMIGSRSPGDTFPLAGSATGRAKLARRALIIATEEEDEVATQVPGLLPAFRAGIRSVMMIPLISRGRVIGILVLQSTSPRAYTEKDLRIGERIGQQIAGPIANAQLYAEHMKVEDALRRSDQEAKKVAAENALMAEIGRIISSTLNIEEVYASFSEKVKNIIHYDRLSVNVIGEDGSTLVNRYVIGDPAPERNPGQIQPLHGTLTEAVIQKREGILVEPLDEKDIAAKYPGLLQEFKVGFRSFLSVPLISGDRPIGGLHFRAKKYGVYSEEDRRLAQSIGNQIAGAVANAKLYDERQRGIRALRDSEEKYRLLVENASEAIFIAQDGVIKFPNARTLEWSGYSAEELITIPFKDHIHADDREMVLNSYKEMIEKKGSPPKAFSFRIKTKSGKELWVELFAVSIQWEGKPATLNFIRNVTEQKKLEAQFLQAQKMEAVGQLAGGIAHDFNNLLTIINTHAQIALTEIQADASLKPKLESIQRAGERAASLTRQLLAFSRRQALEMKTVDLNSVLQELEKMLARVIRENIELHTVLGENLGKINADPGQIEQAILNLVVNARDAMPSGGELRIETANIELDREYARTHLGVKPGPYVMLAVSDTGVGMTPEIRKRIFEPFFTTKEKFQGTGLGLSTVYGMVEQSGGKIWVYSEPGRGTTFKIYFPRIDKPCEEEEKKEEARKELPQGRETILVVEDEEDVRKLVAEMLRKLGYPVLEVSNAKDALQACEQCKGKVQLLLTDVVMPGLNGPVLAMRLKYLYPDIKTLFMSGYTDGAIFQQGLLDDEVALIQKPFSVEGLAMKVREVLDCRSQDLN